MDGEFTTCSSCGRRIPLAVLKNRNEIHCACGMRIQPAARVLVDSRLSVVALMLLAAAIVLFTAVAALAFRVAG